MYSVVKVNSSKAVLSTLLCRKDFMLVVGLQPSCKCIDKFVAILDNLTMEMHSTLQCNIKRRYTDKLINI
jgi:hypothetical protein